MTPTGSACQTTLILASICWRGKKNPLSMRGSFLMTSPKIDLCSFVVASPMGFSGPIAY